MFTCINCIPKSQKWLFTLAMGISFGPCESCGAVGECVDWHGNFDEVTEVEPLDTYKYDRE